MYFADSRERTIWAYDFDVVSGTPRNKRVFATTEDGVGPDGSTVDAAGYLWNAQWGASRVRRYSPDGEVDFDVKIPATQTSCCCFGGPGLETLFVTSARVTLSPERLAKEPKAGGVFAVTFDPSLGIRGVPEPRFAG
jgi:L-arabinonolactonase